MDANLFAQLTQKRECPHGTRATAARGWIRQTSHLSDVSDESMEVVAFPVSIHWRWTYVTSLCSCRAICMSLQMVARISCRLVGMSTAGSNGRPRMQRIMSSTSSVVMVLHDNLLLRYQACSRILTQPENNETSNRKLWYCRILPEKQ